MHANGIFQLVILVFWGKVSVSLFRLFFLAKQNTLAIRHHGIVRLEDFKKSNPGPGRGDGTMEQITVLAGSKLMQMDVIFGKMVLHENGLFGLVSYNYL